MRKSYNKGKRISKKRLRRPKRRRRRSVKQPILRKSHLKALQELLAP